MILIGLSLVMGYTVTGYDGDRNKQGRPSWNDESFMAFRQLRQYVPEFNNFLTDNWVGSPPGHKGEWPEVQGRELLGARMVGRWKRGGCSVPLLMHSIEFSMWVEGAPTMLTPWRDNPEYKGFRNILPVLLPYKEDVPPSQRFACRDKRGSPNYALRDSICKEVTEEEEAAGATLEE
ncbi:hypothetical protein AX16_002276 [Volvariella volvacea WC 439]|nr:hypothetical protein AX16_002276 [Volvariella volvacea WC 439]